MKKIISTYGNMNFNKNDLRNLTKDQLIDLLLKEQQKVKPQKKPKKVKQKRKLNGLEWVKKIEDELKSELEKTTAKYNKMREVVIYPIESISMDKFRKEEAVLAGNFKKGSSFVNLFSRRLDGMKGERETVSITLFVEISTNLTTEEKTYGPFETEIPNLSKKDMYKFMVYILMENNFTLLSAQSISKIGCKILTHNKAFFMKHRMGRLKLESYLLSNNRKIKSHGESSCVLDYVWDQVKGKRGFMTYDYDKLKEELYSYASEKPIINTEELIDTVGKRMSFKCIDSWI